MAVTGLAGAPVRVLVVDDDSTVRGVVADYLTAAGFTPEQCGDGSAALAHVLAAPPALIVLDVMLPGLDGLEVFRRLRQQGVFVPVIMLTAKGSEADRILGLEIGADDYLTKPFSARELVLRVSSILRRAGVLPAPGADAAAQPQGVGAASGPQMNAAQPGGMQHAAAELAAGNQAGSGGGADRQELADGDLRINVTAGKVYRAGKLLSLTLREYDLLVFLLRNPDRVFSREQLMLNVWGWELGDASTVTVHVRRLREKIEADVSNPRRLVTVWGRGYRWERQPAGGGAA